MVSLVLCRYKERLDLKYLKSSKQSATLEGGRWTFLAGNMDDFRSGVPAQTDGSSMVVKVRMYTYHTSCLEKLFKGWSMRPWFLSLSLRTSWTLSHSLTRNQLTCWRLEGG